MKPNLFFVIALFCVFFVGSVSAVTVSSAELKWTEINVKGEVSHIYTVTDTTEGAIEFSPNLNGICKASPAVVHGSGEITVVCTPKANVVGYVRVGEPTNGMIAAGIVLPVSFSMTGVVATELPTPAPTPTPTLEATQVPPVVIAPTEAPVVTQTTAVPVQPVQQSQTGMFVVLALGALVAVFVIVAVYDQKREKKARMRKFG
jgi:hypothetical protein